MKDRYWKHAALAGISLLFGSLVARAYDTSWISSGQAISAAKLKPDLDEVQTRLASLEAGRTVSPVASGVNIASAYINLLSGAVSIGRQDGSWLTSATRTGTGTVQLDFATSFFSAPPTCVANSTYNVDTISAVSATSATILSSDTAGVAIDRPFYVVCIGAK